MGLGKVNWKLLGERIFYSKYRQEHYWFMWGQNVNLNRSLKEADLNFYGQVWGVQDFSRGSNFRCDWNCKRTVISSGAWGCPELLQSHDKTWIDKVLLLMDEEKGGFLRWNLLLVKVLWTLLMMTEDLEDLEYLGLGV
jgi:hypothetical protein